MLSDQLSLNGVQEVGTSYRKIKHRVRKSTVKLPKGMTAEQVLTLASELVWEMNERKFVQIAGADDAELILNEWLVRRYVHQDREVFGVVWLDTAHHVLTFQELSFGTIDGAAVYPREVVKSAITESASACVIFHNHPAQTLSPSGADHKITRMLVEALKTIDVKVLDHLIVGGAEVYSFAKNGKI